MAKFVFNFFVSFFLLLYQMDDINIQKLVLIENILGKHVFFRKHFIV